MALRLSQLAGVCLVSATVSAGAHTDRPRFDADCNRTDITEKDIRNFHQVDAYLYRGARPKCSGYQKLARMGVRTIVSLQGGTGSLAGCDVSPKRPGFHFHFISFDVNFIQTGVTGISSEDMERLFRAMRDAPKPIFIECRYGKDRTGAVVAIYRIKEREMSFEQAKREALQYGLRPRFLGLAKTIDRYRDRDRLASLPSPDRSRPRANTICRDAILADSVRSWQASRTNVTHRSE